MLAGEAILQRGCEQGSTECQRKGCVSGDSRWTKEKERKKEMVVGVSKVNISVVTPATVLPPVLVFDSQCLPAHPFPVPTGQISEWLFVFLPVPSPPAVPPGAAIPALLPLAGWHSCCALQLFPAKAMEIWLLPSVRAGDLAGCKLWPKISVISLCK